MTQEEKQLLLIDLSARLPYRVQVFVEHDKYGQSTLLGVNTKQFSITVGDYNWSCTSNIEGHRIEQYKQLIKPYLRPMSSMTEEEKKDYWEDILGIEVEEIQDEYEIYDTIPSPVVCNDDGKYFWMENFYLNNTALVIDWLNKHHFDYRRLIEKGLALEAPEDMYK